MVRGLSLRMLLIVEDIDLATFDAIRAARIWTRKVALLKSYS